MRTKQKTKKVDLVVSHAHFIALADQFCKLDTSEGISPVQAAYFQERFQKALDQAPPLF